MTGKWLRSKIPHRRLELQKCALSIKSTAVSDKTTIGSDDPMARNNDRYGVLTIYQSNRPWNTSDSLRLRLV
jgi:hypothetical protein